MPRHPAQTPLDGARIPLLEDVLALAKMRVSPGFRLYIELKTALLDLSQSADPGMLAETAVEMTRAWDLSEIVTFVSFDWRALARAKQLAPGITNAFTTLPLSLLDPEDASAAQDEPGSERERLRLAPAGGRRGGPASTGVTNRERTSPSACSARSLAVRRTAGSPGTLT
jgi:glycerophosphoryl diester phosphodiesterase